MLVNILCLQDVRNNNGSMYWGIQPPIYLEPLFLWLNVCLQDVRKNNGSIYVPLDYLKYIEPLLLGKSSVDHVHAYLQDLQNDNGSTYGRTQSPHVCWTIVILEISSLPLCAWKVAK